MDVLFIAVLFASYSLASVWSIAVKFTCPPRFYDGENIVNCTINVTAIEEANCLSTSKSVMFDRTTPSGTIVVGMYNYEPNQPCTNGPQHTPGSCWCSHSDGKIFTYTFSYLANSTLDQGGQLDCKICILPEIPLTVQVDDSCRNMNFSDSHLESTTAGRENTTETAEQDLKTDGNDLAALIGGIIGAVVAIALIITAAVLYCKKQHKFCWSSNENESIEMKPNDEEEGKRMISTTEENDGKTQQNGSAYKPANGLPDVHFKK